jgi:3-methyladenine DNA glycosylase AlkD
MSFNHLTKELQALKDPARAESSMSFFKTGKGQYGAGDVFLGINVPNQRKLAKKYQNLPLTDLEKLLQSKYHEYRLTALFILVSQYRKGGPREHAILFKFYCRMLPRINNWDLVDTSARPVVGEYLCTYKTEKQAMQVLTKMARSKNLWERRVAVVAAWAFSMHQNPTPVFTLTGILLHDTEDLMHKACGWMLREVGRHCGEGILTDFLNVHASLLPRTTLRYAIEHYSPRERQFFLAQKRIVSNSH